MKSFGIFAVLAAQLAGLVANARHTLRRAAAERAMKAATAAERG